VLGSGNKVAESQSRRVAGETVRAPVRTIEVQRRREPAFCDSHGCVVLCCLVFAGRKKNWGWGLDVGRLKVVGKEVDTLYLSAGFSLVRRYLTG